MKASFTYYLLLFSLYAFSQQQESTVSISCYVNPELYLKGGIIAFVSTNSGNYSCKGRHVTIYNGSDYIFYYRLNPNAKNWNEVKPYKQVIIPIPSSTRVSSGLTLVRLHTKYQEDISGNISVKIKTIAKMNAESDKVKARELRGASQSPGKKKIAQSKGTTSKTKQTVKAKTPSPSQIEDLKKKTPPKASVAKEKTPAKIATKIKMAPSTTDTLSDSTMNYCYYASDTAYYSFYYIKIRDTVLYSLPFPVEKYEDESYGQRVLSNAWGCLSEKIINQFGEGRYNAYLNDVDYDLMTGFQHIRNPHIPSDTIISEYPYTTSFTSAEAELKSWIKNEKALNKNVEFLKIDFP